MTEKDKNYYRNLAKNNLLGLTAKDEQNRDVLFKFIAVYEEVKPKKVAAYISKSNEADTSMIIRFLWNKGVKVYAPRVENGEMRFFPYEENTRVLLSDYGIYEPVGDEAETDFDIVLTPLLAFDSNFNRLGKGKGCYDKFLKNSSALKIGLAYREQYLDYFPVQEHDVPLDFVLYENNKREQT